MPLGPSRDEVPRSVSILRFSAVFSRLPRRRRPSTTRPFYSPDEGIDRETGALSQPAADLPQGGLLESGTTENANDPTPGGGGDQGALIQNALVLQFNKEGSAR